MQSNIIEPSHNIYYLIYCKMIHTINGTNITIIQRYLFQYCHNSTCLLCARIQLHHYQIVGYLLIQLYWCYMIDTRINYTKQKYLINHKLLKYNKAVFVMDKSTASEKRTQKPLNHPLPPHIINQNQAQHWPHIRIW